MADLTHTPSGGANLQSFLRSRILVYVEGSDDRAFWKRVFPSHYLGRAMHFKPLHGKLKLLQYAEKIAARRTKAVVAMDSDYDEICGLVCAYPFVVKTRRYSVENYLYEPAVIDAVADLRCPDCELATDVAGQWLAGFIPAFRELVYLDCTSVRKGLGIKVLGATCAEFLRPGTCAPDTDRIEARVAEIRPEIHSDSVDETRTLFAGRNLAHHIRGDYITHGVRTLIKTHARQMKRAFNVSGEQFFDLFILAFEANAHRIPQALGLKRAALRALKAVA